MSVGGTRRGPPPNCCLLCACALDRVRGDSSPRGGAAPSLRLTTPANELEFRGQAAVYGPVSVPVEW